MYTSHIWLMAAALAISVGLDCADAFAPGLVVSRPMQADVRFDPGVTLAMGRGDNDADADADASSNGGHWPHQRPVAGRRAALLSSLAAAFTITAPRPPPSQAAPPMAVIAEELGYYPVTDRDGNTLYVPARVKRPKSTDQANELAEYLSRTGAKFYGAYWCPHCSRQKEMFGREAWSVLAKGYGSGRGAYVECSPKGYGADVLACSKAGIDGFPTWRFGNGKEGSGEMTLDRIAEMSGFTAPGDKGRGRKFDASLEEPLPPMGGGESCR